MLLFMYSFIYYSSGLWLPLKGSASPWRRFATDAADFLIALLLEMFIIAPHNERSDYGLRRLLFHRLTVNRDACYLTQSCISPFHPDWDAFTPFQHVCPWRLDESKAAFTLHLSASVWKPAWNKLLWHLQCRRSLTTPELDLFETRPYTRINKYLLVSLKKLFPPFSLPSQFFYRRALSFLLVGVVVV